MPNRVNRAIELLAEGQPVYYTGPHAGHVLTYAHGTEDTTTWGGLYQRRDGARSVRHGGFGRVFTRTG